MRYTVTWLPIAEDELMNLWIQGPYRQAVTDASNRFGWNESDWEPS
jgi:hypothetical protein